MAIFRRQCCFVIVLSLCTYAHSLIDVKRLGIPIGAIFSDYGYNETESAFRYAVKNHNTESTSKFFNPTIEKKDVSNCYELSTSMCDQMSMGVFALFGTINWTSIDVILSYSQTLHMPYITPSLIENPSSKTYDYVISTYPSYLDAIISVIKFYHWEQVSYIYDSGDGLLRLQKLYASIRKFKWRLSVDMRRISNIHNSYELLRSLDRVRSDDPTAPKRIILDLSSNDAYELLLEQIVNVGMNKYNYHYIIGGLGINELDIQSFLHGGVNMTGFRIVDPNDEYVRRFIRQWSTKSPYIWPGAGHKEIGHRAALTYDGLMALSYGLDKMLRTNSDTFKFIFRRGKVWNNSTQGIICRSNPIQPWIKGQEIIASVKESKYKGLTGHVEFDEHGFRNHYTLDVLELKYKKGLEKVGYWSQDRNEFVTNKTKTLAKKKEAVIETKIIVITSIMIEPFLQLKPRTSDGKPLIGNERYEGFCKDLADGISKKIGFKYRLELVGDGAYGAYNTTNGKWNGMIGELTDNKVDLAIAPLTITECRQRVVKFSKPFMDTGISIMIKKPDTQKPDVFSFMEPLAKEVWMCITLAYMTVSLVLYFVSRFSPYEWQTEDTGNGSTPTNKFTPSNTLWFSLGALMQQGSDISPRSISGRIVGSGWWFFTLIIISSYTANLAAFLTIERMLTPIKGVDDLVKQTAIQYGTVKSGSTRAFFTNNKVSVYQRMWTVMKTATPSVFVDEVPKGVEKVRVSKSKYAFLLESAMNDYYNQRKPCNTIKVGRNLDNKGYGVAAPRNSILITEVDIAILEQQQYGVIHKLKLKWWYDKGQCGQDSGKDASQSALTLSNVSGIFYILIGGLIVSMFFALIEFICKYTIRAKKLKGTSKSARSPNRRQMASLNPPSYTEQENGGVSNPEK